MLMRVRSVTAIHISKSGDGVDVHLHDAGLSAALAGSSSLLHLLCKQFLPMNPVSEQFFGCDMVSGQ